MAKENRIVMEKTKAIKKSSKLKDAKDSKKVSSKKSTVKKTITPKFSPKQVLSYHLKPVESPELLDKT